MEEIGEVKSLRWLANNFPFIENPEDDADKISNAIHVYCTAGADKIEALNEELVELKELLNKKGLNKNGKEE